MNIKLLKFIVVFMGIIIFFGIISLGFAIYFKFNNISNNNSKAILSINAPQNMDFIEYKISENQIFLSYENSEKLLISIFNIKTGRNIKKIEILK
tara:strand:+ start:121 stop:405 length:285 start_codon:yes stop_codon:yes gene_type:complete